MTMKKGLCFALALLLLCACALPALADEAGALTEMEVQQWVLDILTGTVGKEPLNAPITEEALTEDGYAMMYENATLYYDKPVLDEQSVLKAFTFTSDLGSTPRGVRLGDTVETLLALYGWQNPSLSGEGALATLYVTDLLPQAAYWAWAQKDENGEVAQVRCAVHSRIDEDRYTDAGILYLLQGGLITGIQCYGLDTVIPLAQVKSNLAALGADAGGSAAPLAASGAEQFTAADAGFDGLPFLGLTEDAAKQALGLESGIQWVADGDGAWMGALEQDGVTVTFTANADKSAVRADSIVVTRMDYDGPRGLRIGDELESVAAKFFSDGEGRPLGEGVLLYGDGQAAPYALLDDDGSGTAVLRYVCQSGGAEVTLYLTFLNNALSEMMIYSW